MSDHGHPSHHFISRTISARKSLTAAARNRALQPPVTDNHRQENPAEQALKKCTDGDMVTLTTADSRH